MKNLKRFSQNYGAVFGLVILTLIILMALTAPILFPGNPWRTVAMPLLRPMENPQYLLGTDMLGRDIAAGIAHGAKVSLLIGVVSTAVAVLIGVSIGALAGFFGGRADDLLMRFTEFFQIIPAFAMAVVLVAIFSPNIVSITLAIAVVSWPGVARLVRAEFLSLREREFVQAAVVIGQSAPRIILTQVLPNAISPIIVTASLMVATAILTESALSFLGLGDRNMMSWGFMIGAARTMLREAWWMSFFPGLAILLSVLAINLIGEGINDLMNPHLRGRKQ
ncbi:ABC transporter permease [Falsochrobactrum shanghaiense]|uniref:ABC transporter permease n=1 Tax=Falsochrobactrum shanghaiense TaxID=2201899 RepID=A0A316JCW8_9HYPH|nr:ABC transporter permease [Falsochrobactrum shanghaiense]PWL18579.1 ABC transporter permease [Falsochrobactrum shanghaiense]